MQHQRLKQQLQALMHKAALLQQQSLYRPGLLAAPQHVEELRQYVQFGLWWVALGVASSIGLGPHISFFTLKAMQCGRVDLKSAPYDTIQLRRGPSWLDKDCSEFGPPVFLSLESMRVPLSSILPQIQMEAILWGFGTALGELPPYFISRAGKPNHQDMKMVQLASKEPQMIPNKKRIRQPISVPFLWEEKPGTPKGDWKPSIRTVNPVVVPLPVKLVASIPFEWEEKPGTPLRRFSQSSQEEGIQPEKLFESYPPQINTPDNGDENGSKEEQYRIVKSDVDGNGFGTDGSCSSAPSAPTSCLVSTLAVSNAVPNSGTSWTGGSKSGELKLPSSPDSEKSYATGTSLVGEALLECLFPLLSSPHSGFLEKHDHTEKTSSTSPRKVQSKYFDHESNCSVAVKRSLTLGELLMMSSRISYQRKEVQMQIQNLPMIQDWMGMYTWIEGLQRKWKRQLRLKPM